MVCGAFFGSEHHSEARKPYVFLWFLNSDFDFWQNHFLHMFYNGYFTFARVQNRHSETIGKQSWNGCFLGQKCVLTSIWDRKTNGFWTTILTFGKVAFCICFIMVISLLPECKIVTQNRYVLNGLRSIFRLGAPFGGSETICFPMVFEQRFWLLAKSHFAYVL